MAPLRLDLVGAGRVARAHLAAVERHADLLEFVACVDPSPIARDWLGEAHPVVAWHATLESLLARPDSIDETRRRTCAIAWTTPKMERAEELT